MAPDPQAAGTDIAGTAARWVTRRAAGLGPTGKAELQAWLRADPRHAAAFAAADPEASELDWPLHTGTLDRVLAGLAERAARRRVRRRRWACTGAVAALLAVGVFFALPPAAESTRAPAGALVVHRPELRTLPDGSVVELKGDADLRIAFTTEARRIELRRGTAHFTVREDPARPFLVMAGGVTARAVGTAFLVGVEPGQVALVVTEGRVALDRSAPADSGAAPPETLALVHAGESISVVPSGAASPRLAALPAAAQQQRLAWRTPRLEFHGTPLGEIVAVLNRHNRTQLVLGAADLAGLKLSGTLSADRIDALLEMLEADFGVGAETSGETIVLRRRAG
jgi:transmembrane sensor